MSEKQTNRQTDRANTLVGGGPYKKTILTLSQMTYFRPFQTEFADINFKFDENGRKFSKRLENTVGIGEIACYEQFLLFPQCFQKTCTADT